MRAVRKHQIPGQGPICRDRLLPLVYRRATLTLYRRSGKHAARRLRVGTEGILPVPSMADVWAVYLSETLPPATIMRWPPSRLFRLACGINRVCRMIYSCARLAFHIVRPAWRLQRRLRQALAEHSRVKAMDRLHFVSRPPVADLDVLIGGSVRLRGFTFEANVLRCFLQRVGPVPNRCQIFVHVYPEDAGLLPPDRAGHGFFCKDHDPALELSRWPRSRVYRDEVPFDDLPPGFHRVEIGVIDVSTLERMAVEGTDGSAVNLGWLRVNDSRPPSETRAHAGA